MDRPQTQEQYEAATILRILANLIDKGTLRRARLSIHNDDGPYSIKHVASVLDDGGREAQLIIDIKGGPAMDSLLGPYRRKLFDERIGQVDRLKTRLRDESYSLTMEERNEAAGLLEAFLYQLRRNDE